MTGALDTQRKHEKAEKREATVTEGDTECEMSLIYANRELQPEAKAKDYTKEIATRSPSPHSKEKPSTVVKPSPTTPKP
ncbi:hypothetical protein PHLCEN_2v13232 [Hermanssonia centrifuga]|uniref:Uncharacterized protein n=1 Tax=Hermanssonia centrifuga TaxID=98765 RepID=A0A2R6NEQ3_9APHY|nr:hypothetical protein PHLCEN_2v13232 [Hermanssonia centrifuga]